MDSDTSANNRLSPRRLAWLVGLAVLAGLSVLGAAFYRQVSTLLEPYRASGPAAEQENTQDFRIQRGPLTKTLQLMGTVRPEQARKLSFQRAYGVISDVPVTPGQEVSQATVLVELDATALQNETAKQRTALLEARRKYDALVQERGVTKRVQLLEQLRQAIADHDAAKQALEVFEDGRDTVLAKSNLARMELQKAKLYLAGLEDGEERRAQIDALQVSYNEAEVRHGPYVLIEHPSEQDRDKEWLLRNEMLDRYEALQQARLQFEMDLYTAQHGVAVAARKLADLDRQVALGADQLEHTRLQAGVEMADAQVLSIRTQLDALDSEGLDIELAKAQAEVLKLEGKVSDAEAAVAESTLLAPFDGVVDQLQVQPGMVVQPGTELLTLISMSDLHLVVQANEVDAVQLSAGQRVQVTLDAFPGEELSGTLGDIPAFGTYQNGLTTFEIQVKLEQTEVPLWIGMSANVGVPMFREEDVVLVPAAAVQWGDQGPFVVVVQETRTARRLVQLGISDGVHYEVIQGLTQGEIVRVLMQNPVMY